MPRKFSSNTGIDGLLIVDKPLGLSSMGVVRHVRRAAANTKTGHAGTLDPQATGIVICCLGKATRCVETLMDLPKTYQTIVDLSAFTNTDDAEGDLQPVSVDSPPTRAAVEAACVSLTGHIQQTPPAFSAIHVAGQRAYKLARKGHTVRLSPRTVRIDAIDVLDYQFPRLSLRIACGRGVYIRALARQLASALHTGGYLASLRRTAVGPYSLEQAWSIEQIDATAITADRLVPPPAPATTG